VTSPAPDLLGWSPDTSVSGAGWAEATADQRAAALVWSVHTLWALSGRRFHLAARRVAPFLAARRPNAYAQRNRYATPRPWASVCGEGSTLVRIPQIAAVTRVEIAGEVLPTSAYVLDPDGALVRTDGSGWPVGQDVYAPDPVWVVDAVIGTPPPAAGNIAAGRYAGELLRASKGQPCAVPARARSIARPGLTIEPPDPATLTEQGRTGSAAVDRWLATVNPAGYPEAATVSTPDLHRHRFLT
jgi:hypothetical protein